MLRNTITVKVLRNYDGFTAGLVETVQRIGIRRRNVHRGQRMGPEYTVVSYKGTMHKVFALPPVYGPIAGLCITE
jgi:hypothetical protein